MRAFLTLPADVRRAIRLEFLRWLTAGPKLSGDDEADDDNGVTRDVGALHCYAYDRRHDYTGRVARAAGADLSPERRETAAHLWHYLASRVICRDTPHQAEAGLRGEYYLTNY